MRAHCIKQPRERESAGEGGERETKKKGAREKDTNAFSLVLSRHHHHLAIQLLTRKSEEEQEREKYREKKTSYDPNYCRLGQQRQQQQLQCAKNNVELWN